MSDDSERTRFMGADVSDAGPKDSSNVGLTKRELLAALCLQGILANPQWRQGAESEHWAKWFAADAVVQAEALLAELSPSK